LEPLRWIRDGTDRPVTSEDPSWQGNRVSLCIPPIFPAYGKVFHPIFADPSVEDHSLSWAAADDAPSTYGRLVSVSPALGTPGTRVRWRTLADELGLLFHEAFTERSLIRAYRDQSMPRYLLGPEEGSLDARTLGRMITLLRPHTAEGHYFFGYDVIATTQLESDLLYEGQLDEVLLCCELNEVRGSPTYWWPGDRSWLVCTDWDLCFTLLGGSAALIGDLVNDAELEAVAVKASTRIDYKADTINK
jgi:hypothetical protein